MNNTEQLTLAIESAIAGGSLSLIRGKTEIANWIGTADKSKAEELLANIDEMLTASAVSRRDLDLVAVSAGPGSFTGIRIGIATALGLKTGLGVKMSSVSALEAMAAMHKDAGEFNVAVPVGRNSICVQPFETSGSQLTPLDKPRTVADGEFGEVLHDSMFVLHRSLYEKYAGLPSIIDFGANIAYAVGIAASPGVVAVPLFISKSF